MCDIVFYTLQFLSLWSHLCFSCFVSKWIKGASSRPTISNSHAWNWECRLPLIGRANERLEATRVHWCDFLCKWKFQKKLDNCLWIIVEFFQITVCFVLLQLFPQLTIGASVHPVQGKSFRNFPLNGGTDMLKEEANLYMYSSSIIIFLGLIPTFLRNQVSWLGND